jgi:hypothetical protein
VFDVIAVPATGVVRDLPTESGAGRLMCEHSTVRLPRPLLSRQVCAQFGFGVVD